MSMGHIDVYCTEKSKHHSLNVADKEFEEHHEDAHQNADRSDDATEQVAHEAAQTEHDEYHAGERDGYGVACQHIGKESNHQHDRLDEHAEKLDNRHQRHWALEPCRYFRPEYFAPVVAVARHVGDEEGAERQARRYGDVARHVAASRRERYNSHQVGEEDKEETGKQIWSILVCLLAESGLDEVIVY